MRRYHQIRLLVRTGLSTLKSVINAIVVIAVIPFIISCTLLPTPINTALSAGQTLLDVRLVEDTGKTTSEHLASRMTGKDCKWARVNSICMTKEEQLDFILSKNCKTITWNWLGLPKCK